MTYPGMTAEGEELSAVDNGLVDILLEAQTKHFSVSGDFARKHAPMVGMAASMGLITTKVHQNIFGRDWLPTAFGLRFLSEVELEDGE